MTSYECERIDYALGKVGSRDQLDSSGKSVETLLSSTVEGTVSL